jgi:glyoxylase-like metal-dependent hydrolase (beta-lactamase superfamily II)
MNVELIVAGWLSAPAGVLRRDDDLDRFVRVPVPAYVIETAEERILVDTGLHPAAVADPERHYGRSDPLGPFRLEVAESVADQVDLATITKIVLTHLHFDHAAGLSLLPTSVPIVVQRREWEAAHDAAAIARNYYLPADYAGVEPDRIVFVDATTTCSATAPSSCCSPPGTPPATSRSASASGS